MDFKVIGINHRTAPVEVRESFSLSEEFARRFLCAAREGRALREAMILDTCNRTEVYFVPGSEQDSPEHVLGQIAALKQLPLMPDSKLFYTHEGLGAVHHLFRVAASLDSQIVGEQQILGQVKQAYRLAVQERTAGFLLNKVLHWSFRVGKRVQSETELGRGSASVAQAAVELAGRTFSTLAGKTVLLIGAGQTAQLTARALMRHGIGRITVANRTLENARLMAQQLLETWSQTSCASYCESDDLSAHPGATCPAERVDQSLQAAEPAPAPQTQVISLDQIPSAIPQADFVISSSEVDTFALRPQDIAPGLRESGRPLLVIDIGVPRNVDPRVVDLPNVFLYNIDDLDRLVAQNIQKRRLEIPKAEAIVQHELRQFGKWLDSLRLTPTIKLLREHFESLRQAEIDRYGHQFNGQSGKLDLLTQSLCSKLLHKPLSFMAGLSEDGRASESLAAIEMIHRIFDLKAPDQGPGEKP